MTKAEFGRRMNTSRQNVNTMLRKENWTVDLIADASRVLKKNFFLVFLPERLRQEEEKDIRVKRRIRVWVEMDRQEDFEAFLRWWDGRDQ